MLMFIYIVYIDLIGFGHFCVSFDFMRSLAKSVMLFSSLKSLSILTASMLREFSIVSNFSSDTNESFRSIFPVYTSVADFNSCSVKTLAFASGKNKKSTLLDLRLKSKIISRYYKYPKTILDKTNLLAIHCFYYGLS